MNEELKELVKHAKNFYPGYECTYAVRVALPLWQFTPMVWIMNHQGPAQLDKIFFALIKNGIVTRQNIASRLGVDKDEFVLSHLDALVREGYIDADGDVYSLAQKGMGFVSGAIKEERLEKENCTFVWDDMSETMTIAKDTVKRKTLTIQKELRLNHRPYPTNDDLLLEMAKCFNQDAKLQKLDSVFYDVAQVAGHYAFYAKKYYDEYIAVFFAKPDGELRVDLRVRNKDAVENFELCGELRDKANEIPHWCEEFKRIYEYETLRRD